MLWIKAFTYYFCDHLVRAIFYLPRLFVYHAMCEDQISNQRFKDMERKLYNGIMTPSAVAVVIFGGWLLSYGIWGNWMIAKLTLVAIVFIYHGWCGYTLKQFRLDATRTRTATIE